MSEPSSHYNEEQPQQSIATTPANTPKEIAQTGGNEEQDAAANEEQRFHEAEALHEAELLRERERATMTFQVLPDTFAIMRFPPVVRGMPDFIFQSSFYTISRSSDEVSVVCEERLVVRHIDHYGLGSIAKISNNWRILRLGVMDLSLTGVAARFANILAEHGVNLNIIATYDTDYVLVPQAKLARAIKALRNAGYTVE